MAAGGPRVPGPTARRQTPGERLGDDLLHVVTTSRDQDDVPRHLAMVRPVHRLECAGPRIENVRGQVRTSNKRKQPIECPDRVEGRQLPLNALTWVVRGSGPL